jgi:DNA invertase Pin-like site-specific DNA recombinase
VASPPAERRPSGPKPSALRPAFRRNRAPKRGTKSGRNRQWRKQKPPAIQAALETLRSGDAGGLVVAKLDRLSRSMLDFTAIMARAQKQGWALVALDCAVDTTTPAGEAMANLLATFARFGRRLISQRTKDALAAKRASGKLRGPIGRPRAMPDSRGRGDPRRSRAWNELAGIAAKLTATRSRPRTGGKRWYPSTVRAVLARGLS